jgi:acyl dehydratase
MSEKRVTFTKEQIDAYAEASGDQNPIHLDEDFARSVGLPGVIAHGMLQMGIAGTVAAEEAGGGARLRRLHCRFAGMVVPGDTVTFSAEPAGQGGAPGAGSARPRASRGETPQYFKLDLRAVNQRGEPVLTKATAEYG